MSRAWSVFYILVCGLTVLITAISFANAAFANERADVCAALFPPKIKKPEILIIGDSISIGYGPYLAKKLHAYSIIRLPPHCNAEDTGHTLKFIDHWLAQRQQFDVIMWNNGLWDIALWGIHSEGVTAHVTPLEDYRKNLILIGNKIKMKTAHPIFILSTNVPPNTPYRSNIDIVIYNQVAKKTMQELDIPVIDLYSVSYQNTEKHVQGQQNEGSVHFSKAGYGLLGDAILQELNARGIH